LMSNMIIILLYSLVKYYLAMIIIFLFLQEENVLLMRLFFYERLLCSSNKHKNPSTLNCIFLLLFNVFHFSRIFYVFKFIFFEVRYNNEKLRNKIRILGTVFTKHTYILRVVNHVSLRDYGYNQLIIFQLYQ
jgi:hypothetical protein